MSKYSESLTEAMTWLGEQDKVVFIGQALRGGTFQSHTLDGVLDDKLLEFPVQESFNMQFAIGAALGGLIPVVIIPRLDFLLVATGDILNLLDKIPQISSNTLKPKVLIRTAIGPDTPIHPGHQHCTDYTDLFRKYCRNIRVYNIESADLTMNIYQEAFNFDGSSIIIERGNLYND